jgi:hypothetical protein
MTNEEMLAIAIEEAKLGIAEGGIPIGARFLTRREIASAAATTVVFKRTIRLYMAKPMLLERRAANEAIATK